MRDMSISDEAVKALAKSVGALEAGRRVGWARSYEATERQENAERELNIARSDLVVISKFAAYLYGFLAGAAPGGESIVAQNSTAVLSVLPDAPRRAGLRAGQEFDSRSPNRAAREQDKTEAAQLKKQRARENQRDFKAARDQERKLLMKRYGFPNEAALFNWLEQYRGVDS